ncbi:MAG: hypothetical protein HY866_00435 [Chloroflexi bacterium]|nr:hypothetical protein [Chloroflexota bacterium]
MTCRDLKNSLVKTSFASADVISCPLQVLVIDRVGGPANVLIDTISLLLNREISVTSVDDHGDALRALDYYDFDVVVIGLQENRPIQLAVLPQIHTHYPDRPILAVGRRLPRIYQQYARTYGAREVLNMPERAADLKELVTHLSDRYLLAEMA